MNKLKLTTLSNGIRIATFPLKTPLTTIALASFAGSRYETTKELGIYRILEKMMLTKTKKRSTEEREETINRLGGYIDTKISAEAFLMHGSVISNRSDLLIEIFQDSIQNLVHSQKEINSKIQQYIEKSKETRLIGREIIDDLVHAAAYAPKKLKILKANEYHFSNLGLAQNSKSLLFSEKKLKSITSSKLKNAMKKVFYGENMVFSNVGMDHDLFCKKIDNAFGKMPKKPPQNLPQNRSSYKGGYINYPQKIVDDQNTTVYIDGKLPLNAEMSYLGWFYPGADLFSDDIFAYFVLQFIIGDAASFSSGGPGKGMYSRSCRNIMSKHFFIDSIEAKNFSYSDSGLFGIVAGLNSQFLENGCEIIHNEFLQLANVPVPNQELERAKNRLKMMLFMILEEREVFAEDIVHQILFYGYWMNPDYICKKIDSVTQKDILRISNNCLNSPLTLAAWGDTTSLKNYEKYLK
ncbi:metalloprotease [Anaeramoeba ignava]|uniref:Metalloprotease n=1 Tax=Anaeramoeba ignava TaxID=1746090 RepID=A0A9Q0RBM3_ANAIG|nr:metalloprotease [Anaeramoeba ignava]